MSKQEQYVVLHDGIHYSPFDSFESAREWAFETFTGQFEEWSIWKEEIHE